MTYNLSAIIEQDGKWYVATCPEFGVASQGRTVEKARKNLLQAVQLFLKHADPKEIAASNEPPLITTFKVAV